MPDWCRRIRASCFPPTEEEQKRFELHKSLRCLPQDMDTGGFFVALLKKVKPLGKKANERMDSLARESRGGVDVDPNFCKARDAADAEKKGDNNAAGKEEESGDVTMTESSAAEGDKTDTEPADATKDDDAKPKAEDAKKEKEEKIQKAPIGKVGMYHKHQKKADLGNEDFIPADPALWEPIIKEYGLGPTFPKEQFMVRASGEAKILYFITKTIKEGLINHGIQERVTVISSGLKGFERCSLKDKNLGYRLSQEGIQYVVPHVTKRILSADMDDFHACVTEGFADFEAFSEGFQKELKELSTGSFAVVLKGYEKDVARKMYLSMWKRKSVVNCFVAKVEMEAIMSKLRALGYVAKVVEEKKEPAVEEEGKEKEPAVDENETNRTAVIS